MYLLCLPVGIVQKYELNTMAAFLPTFFVCVPVRVLVLQKMNYASLRLYFSISDFFIHVSGYFRAISELLYMR